MIGSAAARARGRGRPSWSRTQDEVHAGGMGESEDADPAPISRVIGVCRDQGTGHLMTGSRAERWLFGATSALVLAFLYLPLFLIVLYAFNKTNINSWPFPGFSTKWFDKLLHDPVPKEAAWLSVRIALASTAPALLRRFRL